MSQKEAQHDAPSKANTIDDDSRHDAGGTAEKTVPVTEAIRYRRRAQAAEKELAELKELHDKQARALEQMKEQMESRTAAEPVAGAGVRTQGVKETRTSSARNALAAAAARAVESGRRTDLHAYLRLRRSFV